MQILEENRNYSYGGFWIRFVAYIIDQLIIYFVFTLLLAIFTGDPFYQYRIEPLALDSDYWSMTFASIILQVMYYAGMESSSKQATVGKMAMGVKVMNAQGDRITLLNAIGRYFAKILSALPLLFGYIMAGFDSRKQALHDKLANTFVVYEG